VQAEALKGLNPTMNIWRTGGGDADGSDAFAPITNAMSNLPPLLDQQVVHLSYMSSLIFRHIFRLGLRSLCICEGCDHYDVH
jgi:hypothetical protein